LRGILVVEVDERVA